MCVPELGIKNLRNTAVWYRRDLKHSTALYNGYINIKYNLTWSRCKLERSEIT